MQKRVFVAIISLWTLVQAIPNRETEPANEIQLYGFDKDHSVCIPKDVIINFLNLLKYFKPRNLDPDMLKGKSANNLIIPDEIHFRLPYAEVKKVAQLFIILDSYKFGDGNTVDCQMLLLNIGANVYREKFYRMLMKALKDCYKNDKLLATIGREENEFLLSKDLMIDLIKTRHEKVSPRLPGSYTLKIFFISFSAFLILKILLGRCDRDCFQMGIACFIIILSVYYYNQDDGYWKNFRKTLDEDMAIPEVGSFL